MLSPSLVILAGVAAAVAGLTAMLLCGWQADQSGAGEHPARPFGDRWASALSVAMSALRSRLPALGVAALIAGLGYWFWGLILPSLVVAAMGFCLVASLAGWRRSQRRYHQRQALIGVVDLLAQLLPAGHGVRQSLQVLAESGPVALRQELEDLARRIHEIPLEQALAEAQLRLQDPLFALIATTLAVGGRSGGRLTPLLEELARAAHQIESAQSQLRAEQAQGRLGALVIAAMPLGLLAVLQLVNPGYLAPYRTPLGQVLLSLLLSLIALGYLWMLRILRIPDPDLIPLTQASDRAGVASEWTAAIAVRSRPSAG